MKSVLALLFLLNSASAFSTSQQRRVERVKLQKINRELIVSPSVAKANFLHLQQDIDAVVSAGAPWLHLSVQDGYFVPKVSFGSPVVSALRKQYPDTILDCKLGTINPERRVQEFVKAGADIISVHPEATLQLPAVINDIAASGCSPGVVLNPATPVSLIEPILEDVDVVVVMLVNPGHGGKKYLKQAIDKIQAIQRFASDNDIPLPHISVDGGVSASNSAALIDAGANVLVAGGSVFKSDDKEAVISDLLHGGSETVTISSGRNDFA
ncbi:hypothetical protein TrVE_jg13334 [Triparma verrucosa]|uniref:ribulose-phosphate 3-epimerase n=1 Tax=Triparma verrucosa TaxID=1606542 RepID=A0A9W7F2Q4_9STRA|nr:hypothetical protein TrVE_jg13334 [Triparma verrucosa]